MILHAYLTDGYYDWAELFLKSLKYHHGEKFKVILSSRELDEKRIDNLYSLYRNLRIVNKEFDVISMAKRTKLEAKELLEFKKQIETTHVNLKNNVWKTLIADDDRIKEILQVMKDNINEKFMIHFDIDMYFKKPIDELVSIVENNDISIRLRLQSKLNRKTMIGVQGYKLSPLTIEFVENWIENIDMVPVYDRGLGHGQGACYYSYMKFKDKLSWGTIHPRFISPRMLPTDVIWSANTKRGKEKTIKLFNDDFEEMKNNVIKR